MPFNYCNDSFLLDFCTGNRPLKIASRSSSLAVAQVYECVHFLRSRYPRIRVQIITTKTKGDWDKHTSLSTVENTDFFIKEVDDCLDLGCHIAVHSAKDLSFNYPTKNIIAISPSIHPADMLVYGSRFRWRPLPKRLCIGCSSQRRAEMMQKRFPLGQIKEIRGTIEERLEQLEGGRFDAIIIAKAALLRLHLIASLYVEELPPPYHPRQGCLAVTAKRHRSSWLSLFSFWNRGKDSLI